MKEIKNLHRVPLRVCPLPPKGGFNKSPSGDLGADFSVDLSLSFLNRPVKQFNLNFIL